MALPNPRYNFTTISAREIIDQAYLYLEIIPAEIDQLKVKSALFSLNEILSTWINKGILQFNEEIFPVKLQNKVLSYNLSPEVYDIYDVTLASVGRQRNGTYSSSAGGIAQNAFDDDLNTACTQTSPNGSIGIIFSPLNASDSFYPPRVDYVGVLSAVDAEYTLVVEGSSDNINWQPLVTNVRTQVFKGIRNESAIVWYAVKSAIPYQYLRIRETQDATLNITELYFETYINSRYIEGIGRSRYMQISARGNAAAPSLFCLYKNNNFLTINLYGTPSNLPVNQDYANLQGWQNFLICRGSSLTYTINYLKDPVNINPRFIGSLRSMLSANLALQFKPEKAAMLQQIADETFRAALYNDSDGGKLFLSTRNYKS